MDKLVPTGKTIIGPLLFILVLLGTIIFTGCPKDPHSGGNLTHEQEFGKFNELFKEGKAFYTLEEARAIVIDLMPRIEELAGKKFISMPQIRLIDAADAQIIIMQKDSLIRNNSSTMPGRRLTRNEELFYQLMAKTIGGIYEPRFKRLNLVPTHIEPMLRLMQLGYRHGMLVAKMTIAHELTHALQDQHIDLEKKMRQAPGAEERFAFSATIEGHAEFIKTKLGEYLGVRYSDSDKSHVLEFKNSLIKKIISSDSPHILKYKSGMKFISYHYEKGGNQLLWKILEHPPVDTSMILIPETYTPKTYDTFDYKKILDNVYDFSTIDKVTENIPFKYSNFSVSKFSIKEMFSGLEMPGKNHIIGKVTHYQNLLVKYNGTTFARIGFIVLNDPTYTPRYLKLEQNNIMKKADAFFMDMQNNFICENKTIEVAREITTHERVETLYGQKKMIKRKYAVLAKNNMIVRYSDRVFWLDNCEILKIADKIFSRYEQKMNKDIR